MMSYILTRAISLQVSHDSGERLGYYILWPCWIYKQTEANHL